MEAMDDDSNSNYGPSPNKRLKVEEAKTCSSSTDSADSQYMLGPSQDDAEKQIEEVNSFSPKMKNDADVCVDDCSASAVQGSQCSNESSSNELKDLQLELKKAFEQYNQDVETKINVAEVTVESCDNSPSLIEMEESPSTKIIDILTQSGEKVCSVEVDDEHMVKSIPGSQGQSEDPLAPCAPKNSPQCSISPLICVDNDSNLETQLSASTVAQVAAILNPQNCFLDGLDNMTSVTGLSSPDLSPPVPVSHPGYIITGDQMASLSALQPANSNASWPTSTDAAENGNYTTAVVDGAVVVLPHGFENQVYYQAQPENKNPGKKMVTSQTTMPCASRNLYAMMKSRQEQSASFSTPHTPACSVSGLRTSTPYTDSAPKRNLPSYLTPLSARGISTPLSRMSQLSLNSSGSEEERSPPDALPPSSSFIMPSAPYNTPIHPGHAPAQSTIPPPAELTRMLNKTKKDGMVEFTEGPGRESHNAKERARRARIKTACDDLRDLMPGNTSRTDKATLMELSVEYIKHLRSIVGEHYDKEFLKKTAPYLTMEME